MKLFNTLTRDVEQLKPLNPPEVTVYTCGPTVYDYAHVGHWFTYVRWDTVVRTLNYAGYKTKWVMNITDVGHLVSDADEGEDKLEKGARREGKSAWDVAQFYTDDFMRGMEQIRILTPDYITKATDHIPEQIELIKKLEEKGYTYTIDDGVYYDTSRFEGYAAFARLDLDDLQAGARVEYNTQKRNPTDFALWKFSPAKTKRDMEWDSPWGIGFPGWHIECSAMSMKYLGDTLDIHTGGIDHIPVHHTNEIAQSEAVTGKRFSNMWLHSNHVMVNGEKIAKSTGNGIRLQEIIEAGYRPEVLRLHILESHYRSQSKFSWESLEASRNRLTRWLQMSDLRWQTEEDDDNNSNENLVKFANNTIEVMKAALFDDLNTPIVLRNIDAMFDAVESNGMRIELHPTYVGMLEFINKVLGINLLGEDITDQQKQMIADRDMARLRKDWASSDELRLALQDQGIGLNDAIDGARWYRVGGSVLNR